MKRHATHQAGQEGFTLIELLVAMTVFTFMLMIVTTGFIQVVRVHQAGIASRTTQQNTRLVMDAVMKDVRQGAAATIGGSGNLNTVCLSKGSQATQYAVNGTGYLMSSVITAAAAAACAPPNNFTGWKTLNDTSVTVTRFIVTKSAPTGPGMGTVTVTMTMASINNPTLNAAKTACLPGAGSQFCAITTLSSTAALRGGDGT
jgi:prepilin-type N-terminal cleavage/methylation domain-containing protein